MCHLRRGRRAGWVWRWVHTPPPRPSYHNIISEIRRVQVRHTWSSLQSRLVHMVNFRVQIIPGFSRFSWCSALTCWQERSWCCSEVNSGFTRPTKHQQVAKSFVPSLLDLLRTECRDISQSSAIVGRVFSMRDFPCAFFSVLERLTRVHAAQLCSLASGHTFLLLNEQPEGPPCRTDTWSTIQRSSRGGAPVSSGRSAALNSVIITERDWN